MCFTDESRPPIPLIEGAAVDGEPIELVGTDGNRFAGFLALPATTAGSEPPAAAVLVLPDVRGLHPYYQELALRLAEAGVTALAIDYFGRTTRSSQRSESFDHMSHVGQTTWTGLQSDIAAGVDRLREAPGVRNVVSLGFCFGGRISFALASLAQLRLAGVVGFYGVPTGPGRASIPAPVDLAPAMRCPLLGLFGGGDPGIPADAVASFDAALARAGVEHSLVTYPDAPHSFFDRKQEQFADASAAAWGEVLDFVQRHAAASPSDHA